MVKHGFFFLILFFGIQTLYAQKINISGTVVNIETNQKLEYATIIFNNIQDDVISGGITGKNGEFDIEIKAGTYNITIEFLSFETENFTNKILSKDLDIGVISLNPSSENLEEVEVIAEKSTVEIRLDKKIYNVGKDMTVKGGSAEDVLNNVPSVTVDVEGAVSLRGNENVQILINGKPSGMVGFGSDALKQLPADAIEKVEVITSPSARYEAEGTAGILNIVLRKGKSQGFNGSANASIGDPDSYSISGNLNWRTKKVNVFANSGYSYSSSPGNAYFENEYFNNPEKPFEIEDRTYERERKGFNTNLGLEYLFSKTSSVTGSIFLYNSDRESNAGIVSTVLDADLIALEKSVRNEMEIEEDDQIEFNLNFTKTFESIDHKLTLDFRHEKSLDNEDAILTAAEIFPNPKKELGETILNIEDQKSVLFQGDYVLPIGDDKQFEAGFRSSFNDSATDYELAEEQPDGSYIINPNISNIFIYNEKIHAIYSQYGTKFGNLSTLFGLRFENSITDVEIIGEDLDSNKKYSEFFPTVNLAYELDDMSSLTLGYNRRISRPRGRYLNPFPSRVSESNIYQGNPDLNPSISNGVDLGYLKRWDKITFNTSIYYSYATDVFEWIREDTGEETDSGIPIIKASPNNIASEDRVGWEFSINYNPFKWWKINTNFNYYHSSKDGNGEVPDFSTRSWFSRLNSRITLPLEIDWQTTLDYRSPRENFQSKSDGRLGINLAFSKDIFKENATLSFTVSDLLNSGKRVSNTYIEGTSNQYSEFQYRERQIRLNFTYRFNQKKKVQRSNRGGGNDDGGGEGF